jgi:DNA polymerase
MGYAANMGVKLTAEQAYLAWETFRKAYPEVVDLWKKYERAAIKVIKTGQPVRVGVVIFQRRMRKDGTFILRLLLPSGRGLSYMNARVETEIAQRKSDGGDYERDKVFYDGIGHGVGQLQQGWGKVYTYGGKFCENDDQAISRDFLVNGMFLADEMGMTIVMHAHDEIVCEEDDGPFAPGLTDLKWAMESVPEWAPGLLLAAEGFEGRVYKKS